MSITSNTSMIEDNNSIIQTIKTKLQNYTPSSGGDTPSSSGVKLFTTKEQMDASLGNEVGDLAITYDSDTTEFTQTSSAGVVTFPDTVVLDSAITSTSSAYIYDGNGIRYQISLSASAFMLRNYSTYEFVVRYTSSDGITYTRNTTTLSSYDFEGTNNFSGTWNDAYSKFIIATTYIFGGLFQYKPYVIKEYCVCTPVKTLSTNNDSLVREHVCIPRLPDVAKGVKFTAIHSMSSYTDSRIPEQNNLYMATNYDIYVMLDDNPSNIHTIEVLSNTGQFRYYVSGHNMRKYTVVDNVITGYEDLASVTEGSNTWVYITLDTNDYISVQCRPDSSWTVLWIYPDTSWSSLSTGKWILNNKPDSNYLSFDAMGYLPAPTQLDATATDLANGKTAYGKDGIIIGSAT